jgi:hypothetical protein
MRVVAPDAATVAMHDSIVRDAERLVLVVGYTGTRLDGAGATPAGQMAKTRSAGKNVLSDSKSSTSLV